MWILNDFAMISPVDRRFDYFLWEPKPGAQFGDYLSTYYQHILDIKCTLESMVFRTSPGYVSSLQGNYSHFCISELSRFICCFPESFRATRYTVSNGFSWLESSVSNQHVDILPATQTLNEWSI